MLYDHVKYFVFGSGTFIIVLHTLCKWASFVGKEERQLAHSEPAKYKPQYQSSRADHLSSWEVADSTVC